MRPLQSQGRAGTALIPPGWETAHAIVTKKSFTACIKVWAAADGNPTINADMSYPTATDTALYDGDARIQVLNIGDTTREFGAEYQATAGYLVVIDLAADITIDRGCVVQVTSSSDHSLLTAGRRLVVARVDRGSLRWERDLYCVDTVSTPPA